MEMDLQLSLIAIGVACATAVAVYFVSVIGIREKSFEEAIAEQKKRSDDLLGHHHHKKDKKKVGGKDKAGSKKLKKREKQNNNVVVSDLSDGDRDGGAVHEEANVVQEVVVTEKVAVHVRSEKKSHVEIVDEPEILEDEDDEGEEQGDGGRENDRGLNIPRASSRRSSMTTALSANRRDSIIKPILLNKDESPVVSGRHDVEPANHFEQIHPKDDCELKKERSTENMLENVSTPPSPRLGSKSSGSNTPVDEIATDSPNVSKRSRGGGKKSGKVEDDPSMTAPKIEKLIDRLPLTSSEIQNLIDVLLNKQHAGDNEWVKNTKGGNSVGELKKQIELKDKMLEEEKVSVRGLQDKLKELRNEFSSDKSKFAGVRRSLEEQVQARSVEVQNLQMRLRQVGEMGMSEKQELQKQLQRMQVKFKDVQDEYEAIKADYRNYRDAEQTIRSKADTLERESGALKTQCGHLENQLKNAFASNQDMSNQLRSLQEHMRAAEERKKENELVMNNEYRKLQERETVLLNELAGLKSSLSGLENENAQLRNNVNALEGNIKGMDEVNSKYEEVRKSEVGLKNVVNELKSSLSGVNEVVKEKDSRILELTRELEGVKGKVKELEGGVANGDALRDGEVKGLKGEVDGLKGEVSRLTGEVEAVRGKNDELRHKNQKLVESLNVTEQSLQSRIEGSEKAANAENERKKRAVPLVSDILGDSSDLSSEDWVVSVLTRVQHKVTELKSTPPPPPPAAVAPPPPPVEDRSAEVDELKRRSKELEDEVTHYQGMLKETETLLSNLQASINVEESKWVSQTAEKDREIERLKQLSSNVEELQRKCQELEDKAKGVDQIEELRNTNEQLRSSLETSKQRCEELSSKLSERLEESQANNTQQQSTTATNGSITANGSSSDETPNARSSNNNVNKGLSTPPLSPTTQQQQQQQTTPTTPTTPPSPSTLSTASSSPPKEKKKKKGTSKKQQQQQQ